MDRGAWQATVHRVTKSQTQLKQLSIYAHTQYGYLKASAGLFLMWMVDFQSVNFRYINFPMLNFTADCVCVCVCVCVYLQLYALSDILKVIHL